MGRALPKMPKRAQLVFAQFLLFLLLLLLSICWFATQPLPQKPHGMPRQSAGTDTDTATPFPNPRLSSLALSGGCQSCRRHET